MLLSRYGITTFTLCAGLLTLVGCAGSQVQALSADDSAAAKNFPGVRAVHYEAPALDLMTPGGVVLESLSLGSVPAKDRARQYGIADPAVGIKERLAQALEREGGFKKIAITPAPLPREQATQTGSGITLDVMTVHWGVGYFPADWSRYQLGYGARARLVRLDDGRVLWKGTCNYGSGDKSGLRPTLAELSANNAAVLKQMIAEAQSDCEKRLVDQFFNRDNK